jgi:hypothetical protein
VIAKLLDEGALAFIHLGLVRIYTNRQHNDLS